MNIHTLHRIVPPAGCRHNGRRMQQKNNEQKANTRNKPATQVAARVNAEKITVHQVNTILAWNPNIPSVIQEKWGEIP